MEEMRKQFESAIKERFGSSIDYRVCKNGDGEYFAWDMQVAWWAWQASRTALVVSLPDKVLVEDDFDSGHNCAIDYCSDAISALGIAVKGEGDE